MGPHSYLNWISANTIVCKTITCLNIRVRIKQLICVTYLVCGASTFETESTRNWEFTLGNSLLTKQSITLKGNDGVSLRAEIGSLHTQYLCKTITCLNIKSFECNQSLSLT